MEFNLFTWIREGVKQSVLLGVSDAIEIVGMPEDSEEISPRLLEFMREGSSGSTPRRKTTETRRKRLGKSLKDLDADKS